MDQDILDAQERLIRRREEEKTMAQEDLGYQKNINPRLAQLFPTRSAHVILPKSEPLSTDRVKVTYTRGIAYGLTHILRRDIAEDLITGGFAKEV